MNRRSGLGAVLVVLLIALVVGGLAYAAGLSAGQSAVVAAPQGVPGTVVYPVGWHGFGFGFGIFGFLFLFLLIGLLVRAFAFGGRGRWGGPSGGGWDRSRWESGEVPPPMESMLQAWHRRAHQTGDEPPAGR